MTPVANPSSDRGEPPAGVRLQSCASCGYLLTGLPDRGICPECGRAYEPSHMVTLFGRTGGARAWSTNWLQTGVVIVVLIYMAFDMRRSPMLAEIIVLCAVTTFVTLWERAAILFGSRASVTLWPGGCSQSDATDLRGLIRSAHAFVRVVFLPAVFLPFCLR